MDEVDSRIKEYLEEHLKFDVDVLKDGFHFRAYLRVEKDNKISETTLSSKDVVFDNILDQDTADCRYATKDYVEDNFAFKD